MPPCGMALFAAAAFCCASASATADTIFCGPYKIEITAESATVGREACDAVIRAQETLSDCDFYPLSPSELRIEIVDHLQHAYVASYDAKEHRIRLLAPSEVAELRRRGGAFPFLKLHEYFQSVVVHELAHVVGRDLPCAFDECIVAHEYFGYALQVMSLTENQRGQFEAQYGRRDPVSRDELSAGLLYLAPTLFAQKVWAHLKEQPDDCAFLHGILDGTVVLDRGRFE